MQLMWNSWTPLVVIPLKCCEASPQLGLAIPSHMDRDSELWKRIPVALSVLFQSCPRRMTAHKCYGLMCLQTHLRFRLPIAPCFHIRFLDYHFSIKPVRCGTNILSVWGKTCCATIYIFVSSFIKITFQSLWKTEQENRQCLGLWNLYT
jgi:hypothetical protein